MRQTGWTHIMVLVGPALFAAGCGSVVSEETDGAVDPGSDPFDGAGTDGDGGADADVEAESGGDAEDGASETTSICGNGVIEPPEACDDENDVAGDGCEADCTYSCASAADCDDRNACTEDACEPGGTGRLCSHVPTPGEPCDDGDPCTEGEQCDEAGVCGGGTLVCACRGDGDCTAFEDDDLCNGTLVCRSSVCVVDEATVVVCDSGDDTACRQNVCAPATGVCSMVDEADGTRCDDGLYCTLTDRCAAGACRGTGARCPVAGCVAGCNETTDRCRPAASGTVCRASAGPCDMVESCDGTTTACPANALRPSGYACRASAGACDVAETCTGSSAACPSDSFRA
ncbi:MAG: hypothetical protein JXB32_02775, partial [Deltaproteobacteria bacterium]|nr:hypothetical protein [Deltaproteobacteria bacterium]